MLLKVQTNGAEVCQPILTYLTQIKALRLHKLQLQDSKLEIKPRWRRPFSFIRKVKRKREVDNILRRGISNEDKNGS